MTDKNIIFLFDGCGLSYEEIAVLSGLTIDRVKLIVSAPPKYPLTYTPRHAYK
jgi:hypothetical protein